MKNNNIVDNTSYTNKDFQSTYTELLDLVKKLTNKWDPSLSNESDPGVILLKLNALVADKNNYNIDKNILECFPASVTQVGNARQLYDLLGYKMQHYISATGKVNVAVKNASELGDNTYTIDQFTSITDAAGEAKYVILDPNTELTKDSPQKALNIMQGSIHKYDINGDTLITINNLDNDLRLYFPISQVAQNGIFIKNENETSYSIDNLDSDRWTLVDNLASYDAGKHVYEFGVLNNGTCYIQFPNDISDLILSGLNIQYIVSDGVNGNAQYGTLNSFTNDEVNKINNTDVIINDNIIIFQDESITNGADPESIEDAYKNYKRQVGTFGTLVTRRDYENFIYNIKQSDGTPLISNIKVSDRTSDINYTNIVQELKNIGDTQKSLFIQPDKDVFNAYEIALYGLRAVPSINNVADYKQTFMPITSDSSDDAAGAIESEIYLVKSAQHDIKKIANSDKYFIANNCTLKGQLLTFYKVTDTEKASIENNVMLALMKKYYSRNLIFGESLDYEELIDTIKNADSRIKTVILDTPSYEPFIVNANGTERSLYISNADKDVDKQIKENDQNTLIAKMILSGNVPLFKFNKDFNYEFGEAITTEYGIDNNPISKFSSYYSTIIPDDSANPLKIKENEVIQLLQPSLITKVEYTSYVTYYLNGSGWSKVNIEKDKDFIIPIGCSIKLTYKTTSGDTREATINAGAIISTNVELKQRSETESDAKYDYRYKLGTGEYIREKGINKVTLQPGTKYFCYLKDRDTLSGVNSYVLQDGEYFIYTDITAINQIILGAGTLITKGDDIDINVTTGDIDLSDTNAISLKYVPLKAAIDLTEMEITSFGAGLYVYADNIVDLRTSIEIEKNSDGADKAIITSSNTLKEIGDGENKINISKLFYTDNTNNAYEEISIIDGLTSYIQTRLRVKTSGDTSQLLNYTSGAISSSSVSNYIGDLLLVQYEDSSLAIIGNNTAKTPLYIKSSALIDSSGGDNIDARVLENGILKAKLQLKQIYKENFTDEAKGILLSDDNNIVLSAPQDQSKEWRLPFNFKSEDKYHSYIIPIRLTLDSGDNKITIKAKNGDTAENVKKFPNDYDLILNKDLAIAVMQVPVGEYTSLVIESEKPLAPKDSISVGSIIKLDGENAEDINSEYKPTYTLDLPKILTTINSINGSDTFDWTYSVPDSSLVTKPLSADSFWDINHIYNKYTLPRINFDSSKISVHSSSLIRSK